MMNWNVVEVRMCLWCDQEVTGSGFCSGCMEKLEQQQEDDMKASFHECFSDKNPPCCYCNPLLGLGIIDLDGNIIINGEGV